MKPWSWDKQLGLASPLKCAGIQSGQTKNPSKNEVGLDASHHAHTSPEGRGKYFFLDILSHRTSVILAAGAVGHPPPSFRFRKGENNPSKRMGSDGGAKYKPCPGSFTE